MTRRAWISMAVLASLWGASYLFIKLALEDLDPVFLVFGRLLLGALVLVPIALHRRALRVRGVLGPITVLAVVQVVVPFLLIAFGEEHISSSMAGILVSSAPIFTALLAVFVDAEERSTGWGLAGVVVGMVGVALLFGVDLGGDSQALLGGAMVLAASFGYAIGALYLKRRLRGVPPVGVAASTMSISALILLPAVPFTAPDGADLETVGSMIGLGAGGTGVAFLLFYTLIADVGPARASIVAYIAPVFAIVYGVTLLDEPFGAGTAVGVVLILAGSYTAAERRAPWRARPPAEPIPPAEGAAAGPPPVSETAPGRSSEPAPAHVR